MEATSLPTAAQKPPKLRWYQWRLRSLFILTLLVAIGMSWLTVTIQNQRKQKAAAEAITKLGGTVQSEPTWLGWLLRDDSLVSVTKVYLAAKHNPFRDEPDEDVLTDAGLVHLQPLSQLRELSLDHTYVSDAGLANLEGLSQLQKLWLCNTKVTDAGLVHLQGLSQLKVLDLSDTKVTDAGLVHLQGLSQLGLLDLSDTKVTDTGLVQLKALSQLQELWLLHTKITGTGLVHLRG
ncbi:MAG: hypothetical protein WCB27_19235, partial [Thermoguttaceae bacterium]